MMGGEDEGAQEVDLLPDSSTSSLKYENEGKETAPGSVVAEDAVEKEEKEEGKLSYRKEEEEEEEESSSSSSSRKISSEEEASKKETEESMTLSTPSVGETEKELYEEAAKADDVAVVEVHLHRQRDLLGQFILGREKIVEITIVSFAPTDLLVMRIDQLGVNADASTTLAYATFEDIANFLLPGNFSDGCLPIFILRCRVARDDAHMIEFG